jgi:hypothetical protein
MKRKRLDAESILRQLAEIRRAIPRVAPVPRQPATEGRAREVDGMSCWSEEDFDYAAVADGLSSLADELAAAVDHAAAAATEKALEIYYAAEELARDPAHAELIPHVERMRAAYERDFGRPVPGRRT